MNPNSCDPLRRGVCAIFMSAAMTVTAGAADPAPYPPKPTEDTLVLTPFTVDARRDLGFVAASALAGGRLAVDLKDTPVAY